MFTTKWPLKWYVESYSIFYGSSTEVSVRLLVEGFDWDVIDWLLFAGDGLLHTTRRVPCWRRWLADATQLPHVQAQLLQIWWTSGQCWHVCKLHCSTSDSDWEKPEVCLYFTNCTRLHHCWLLHYVTMKPTHSLPRTPNLKCRSLQLIEVCTLTWRRSTLSQKDCAKLFLPKRRWIFTNFDNFWHTDSTMDEFTWGALIFHLT